MKITYDIGGELVKERVTGQFPSYYITESGAQVRKTSVIKIDRRGGRVAGAGRKEGDKRVAVAVYVTEEEKKSLIVRAKAESKSVSSLIYQYVLHNIQTHG